MADGLEVARRERIQLFEELRGLSEEMRITTADTERVVEALKTAQQGRRSLLLVGPLGHATFKI